MPTVTEARSGSRSERTRTPLSRRVACMRLVLRLLVLPLLLERLLAGETDLPRAVDLEDLYRDHLALLEDVRDFSDPFVRQLRDVDETVGAGEDLHEGTEVDDLP